MTNLQQLLLSALDELFVQKQYRMQALGLLSAFVRLQPPHLYLVLETSLLRHLEKCLLIDTSTTVIELALVVLIMLLPHICGALTSDHHLPKLFLIYSRVLCWDKLSKPEDHKTANGPNENDYEDSDEDEMEDEVTDQAWEQLQPAEGEEGGSPTLMHYFTFMYGLFPLNFMSFVRKSRKYLKSLNFPSARDFDLDEDLIHSRTEPYRSVHLLHPNMFTTTIEEELSENRWLKSDPADVVTDCMDLCVAVSAALEDPGPPPATKLPPIPPLPEIPTEFALDDIGHDSDVSWRNTQSTMFVPSGEAPEMPDTIEMPLRSKSVASAKSFKSASPLLKTYDTMDSPTLPPAKEALKQSLLNASTASAQRHVNPKPSLDSFARSVAGTMSPPHPHHNQSMASLQREIMLLRNDLNFERYLKLQHLSHIGQLQRKHIREAAVEADTQNLINTNKTLKARLTKANELYAQLKKETLTSRTQSKKWESDLNGKVRTYRDSEKTWHSEEEKLRFELQRTQADYEHLKKIVEKAEAEQLRAEQRTRALEYELEDYSNARDELENAQQKIMEYEDQAQDLHSLIQQRNDLRNDLEIANMRLNSREAERERSVTAYERRIMILEQRLQATERTAGPPGQLSSSVQQMLDSALAASHAKLQSLKKTHQNLATQYTELQMKYQDLEAEHQAALGRFNTHEKTGHHEYAQSQLNRHSSLREGSSYGSHYLPPLSTQMPINEEREYFSEYHSPNSVSSPNSAISPAAQRPARIDSMPSHGSQRSQRSPPGPSMYPAFGGALNPDLYEPQALARGGPAAQSSGKSTVSVDTEGSGGRAEKDKVEVKSEVRVYGRGKWRLQRV